MVISALINASVRTGLLVFEPEISTQDEMCLGRPTVEKVNDILKKVKVD